MIGVAVAALLAGTAAQAEMVPAPGYYAGEYVLIGRLADGALIEDRARLSVVGRERLRLESCKMGDGSLGPSTSRHEAAPPLEGPFAGATIHCRFTNDGGNYPRLTCASHQDGGTPILLTFWPEFDGVFDCP